MGINELWINHFERFLDALSTQKEKGLATLKKIAGRQKVFIVVQLSDAYLAENIPGAPLRASTNKPESSPIEAIPVCL